MHELGIMESAVAAALAKARERGAGRIHRIVLRIGALSGVEPDSLQFAFGPTTLGTPAEGADLDIEVVPARARCSSCGIDFEAADGSIFSCPQCDSLSGELLQGREIELSRIEMS
jgi:hydrogenase nickel incorporation protein HypA/HybF